MPSDNNSGESDIRSVAAARTDGGVNRTGWGATAFGRIKSVVRTCQKSSRSFLDFGIELVRAVLSSDTLPLPLNSS